MSETSASTSAQSTAIEVSARQTHLVVATFNSVNAANQAFNALAEKRGRSSTGIQSVAFVQRDAQGRVDFKETGQASAGATTTAGGVLGGVLGFVLSRGKGSGAVVGAGLGALLGSVGSKYIDVGIPDDRLRQIGLGLTPGMQAVAVLVEVPGLAPVKSALGSASQSVTSEPLAAVDLVSRYGGGDMGKTLAELTGSAQNALAGVEDKAMANPNLKSAVDAAKKTADDLKQNEQMKSAMDSVKGAMDSAAKAVNDAAKGTPAK